MNGSTVFGALVLARALAGPGREPEPVPEPEWRATRPAASSFFLAERYLPDVDGKRVDALADRLEVAADELRRAGAEVRFLGSAGLPGDEALLFLFSAPSADDVARTVSNAGVAADRIVPALWRAGHAV